MPKTEKKLNSESLARELELLAKRYAESGDETVESAVAILKAIHKPLSCGSAFFKPVSEFFSGLDNYIAERLS